MPTVQQMPRPVPPMPSRISPADPPSLVDMLGGAASFSAGLVAGILPFILLSVPAIVLVVVPLIVLSIPFVLLGALLAPPYLLVRGLRRRRLERATG